MSSAAIKETWPPYRVGGWYKVATKFIIASAEPPEWGLISVPKRNEKGFNNVPGWKPRGTLYRIKEGELVMVTKYMKNDEVVMIGKDDKFLYTSVAELKRISALEKCEENG
jgi:hypothetical protein